MISILLIILKIIGITLLVIIGLFLLVLLLVLFVPVRYRFRGSYDEKFLCKGKITWLLHLVSIHVDVEDKAEVSIRILGMPLSLFLKKKKGVTDGEKPIEEKTIEEKPIEEKPIEEKPAKADNKRVLENNDIQEDVQGAGNTDGVVKEASATEELTQEIPKQNIIGKVIAKVQEIICKLKKLLEKVKIFLQKIKEVLTNIKEKKDTLKRYISILKSDTVKAAFGVCKNRLGRMLKHLFPRKIRADIAYGMEDPADTGYILAIYGMLPEFVGKNISLQPNFNKQVFKGNFYIKGAIRAFTLLYQVLRVVLDKDCQKLYHIVKKEISNEYK